MGQLEKKPLKLNQKNPKIQVQKSFFGSKLEPVFLKKFQQRQLSWNVTTRNLIAAQCVGGSSKREIEDSELITQVCKNHIESFV